MKHAIIGAGNLGIDLFLEINARRLGEPVLISQSRGVDVLDPDQIVAKLVAVKPDMVWYCVGGGSVTEAKESPLGSMMLNCATPLAIMDVLPALTRFVAFSTDYVADESRPDVNHAVNPFPRSEYARQRAFFESEMKRIQRPYSSVVRVGSLYGVHKPERTFPGKILTNFGFSTAQIRLPQNLVTPTPTRWLAGILLRELDQLCQDYGTTFEHVAPDGNVSVKDWGKFVLRGLREDDAFIWKKGDDFWDKERPLVSALGNTLVRRGNHHWYDLWSHYFRTEWFTRKDLKELLPDGLREGDRERFITDSLAEC
jgi:dTDP-4-dehydrorhamnose reductase